MGKLPFLFKDRRTKLLAKLRCWSEYTSPEYTSRISLTNPSMAIVQTIRLPSSLLQPVFRSKVVLTSRRSRRPTPCSSWNRSNTSTYTTHPLPIHQTTENLFITVLPMHTDHSTLSEGSKGTDLP